MNPSPVDILLVEDHAVVRAGLRRLLEARPGMRVVAETDSGEAAGRLYAQHRPTLMVIDLSLPGISGLEVVRRIVARDPRARILVFSMHRSTLLVRRVLEAGALGYVLKEAGADVLVEAVDRVARGKLYLGPIIAQDVALEHLKGTENLLSTLSPREFEILRHVAEGKSTARIAEQLHLSAKTVSNNISRIKRRLGITSTTEMVLLAIRTGLISP